MSKQQKKVKKNSSVNMEVLSQKLPPLLLPPICNIRGACLGKYWRRDYEKNGNGLTSMIPDDEYFAVFFIRILGLKGYYDVIIHKKSF